MEGYLADFQCNNKERLAGKEVSAITSFCVEFSGSEASGIPNMPMNGPACRSSTSGYTSEWTLCRTFASNILNTLLPCCLFVRHQSVKATGGSGGDKVIDVIKFIVSLIAAVAEPG